MQETKRNALPDSAFVDYKGERVAFQDLVDSHERPCDGQWDLFFADPADEAELEDPEIARDMCFDCPIMMQCLQFARQSEIPKGVFGGELASERVRWVRSNKRKLRKKKNGS
ncbi:WhiB family transcription factor [Arthrobacter phage Thunderclap]|uniref:WhiB family transcription factor n=10 Tax=Amigovirus amigo TaxID=1982100 RepID=A0A0U4INF1_9CAUD|nr:transcriptional regulator WhiB-like [Arthrobacter phage Amigo]ALY08505.1 WhiB family transcription factor [Arthrobacter phage Anansi]ALY09119.1 WhiB family transcription factor [Arthrobacter phage Gorgeous]ALY10138.1 WhiB family transcription factor [Arthrobacter phage Rings]ALY10400.1 WhiB family transcription factor [Arthrobacter phage SorJuana]QFG08354.1 WhiB family transcription factor [Arthrobacter phage Yeezus]QFG13403.1 WhiB family transcription factor [Arthrobacter phage Ichor]QFG